MPDRVIRDELLKSERWLDLPTDTHRVVYIGLLLLCDDYGNLEGGPRRLFRWMHGFTQIKTEADSIKLMSDLQDHDMILRYEVEGKEYWHISRFKNSRWYWKRSYPQSPYSDDVTNDTKQRPSENRNTQVNNTLPTRREGVGVGEGIGEKALEVIHPTRITEVQNLLKSFPEQTPKTNPEAEERNRKIAELVAQGRTDEARALQAGST